LWFKVEVYIPVGVAFIEREHKVIEQARIGGICMRHSVVQESWDGISGVYEDEENVESEKEETI
jgi:hypothetical protein